MRAVFSIVAVLSTAACVTTHPLASPTPPQVSPLKGGVDTHLHLTMASAAKPIFQGEPGDAHVSSAPRNRWVNMVDDQALQHSGVNLVYAALWPPFRGRPGRSAFDEALHQIDAFDDFVLRRPRFSKVLTAAQARQAMARGSIAAFAQLEGGEGLSSVDQVDLLYAKGVRCLTLVHFVSSALGGAAAGQLARALFGAKVEGQREPIGLTDLGKAVVTRLLDLGIVIDLSHGSDALVADVLALTEARGVPVLVSHTGARSLAPMERNLPDSLIKRIAAGGGLFGVTLFADQLDTGAQTHTCDDVVAHWLYLAELVGHQSMLLGSDFNGPISRAEPGGLCSAGLADTRALQALWAALEFKGVPRERLDDQGERLLHLIEQVEAAAKPAAQARALGRQ
jgi:microsomal dipeptidase-like Zn-dependent dipeptidase